MSTVATTDGNPWTDGWPYPPALSSYSAGYSNEFVAGRIEIRCYVERELVVWRDLSGVLRVLGHKVSPPSPAPAPSEKAFTPFRRWASQFDVLLEQG